MGYPCQQTDLGRNVCGIACLTMQLHSWRHSPNCGSHTESRLCHTEDRRSGPELCEQRCNKLVWYLVPLTGITCLAWCNQCTHTRHAWASSFRKLKSNTLQDQEVVTKPAAAILCYVVLSICVDTTLTILECRHQQRSGDIEAAEWSRQDVDASSVGVGARKYCARVFVRTTMRTVMDRNMLHTTRCIAMHLERAYTWQSAEINWLKK